MNTSEDKWENDCDSGVKFMVYDGMDTVIARFIPSEELARLIAASRELLDIARRLSLATEDGDDMARGTHYVAADGLIRCKGSFLTLVEDARAAIDRAEGGV